MRPANQVVKMKDKVKITIERTTSHNGGSNGIRAIITIGDVKGTIENQNAMSLDGFLKTAIAT